MQRLGPGALPDGVVRFGYDRRELRPGIVHLGVGAFFRAHVATYLDDAMQAGGDPRWGVIGASLRHPDQRDRLAPQGCLYTALQRGPEGDSARIVGCLTQVLVAPENPGALLARMADPMTRIVSLTVTEKGYCRDAEGRLDAQHPEIMQDWRTPLEPVTAIGYLVEALRRRRDANIAPFAVLPCDNLPGNGRLVAGLARDFAAGLDDKLAAWIERSVAFPSSMVDRIAPAVSDADIAAVAALIGRQDAAPVVHEPFRQWVIEDRFPRDGRPPLEHTDAQLVKDVEPFEQMKLRLLNGAHSALAYLGYLVGCETIGDAVAVPVFRAFVQRLWGEVLPTLKRPPGIDLNDYTQTLMRRFDNPAIRHRTWQVAMDGSQKLPQRLLAPARERLAAGKPITAIAHVLAAWARYVGGVDEAGSAIDVRDPLATALRRALDGAGTSSSARIDALLSVRAMFDEPLARDPRFRTALIEAYGRVADYGVRDATVQLMAD
ncbi:mannitol dehydrogenase family protein [Oceanibaculum pacificum]|uniref:Mannitol dehydrogenase n=1 Tax=Oceanibaculum pacificum TaxID=580166 RepID=A0A154W2Q8_9PROT|nr:mannitol dehydrogenase family protein [Oceanibaculum pacificum]KZD07786.1 mannitol dehydrogenase [Oceanibaculum pacificum]